MKILVISLPDLKKINPQRYHHILKHLSRKHEVTVLTINAWWLEEKEDEFLKECLRNVQCYHVTESKKNSILQEIWATRSIRRLEGEVDFESFDMCLTFNSLIAGYYIPKKYDLPTIMDVCDDIVNWIAISPQIPSVLKPAGKRIASHMFSKNASRCKRIVFSLDSLRQSFSMSDEKCAIIPNGVDTKIFVKMGRCKDQSRLSPGMFVVGFVGFLGEWVNLSPALEAIATLKNQIPIKALIIGEGSRLNEYKKLSERLQLKDSVIFTGDVPYLKVPEYISCMDICLLPFDRSSVSQNALPLKLFEYMACEKPVISTPLSGVTGAVGSLVTYAESVDEIKTAILDLYNHPDMRTQFGENGGKFVEQHYCWDAICKKYEDLLYNVSNSK